MSSTLVIVGNVFGLCLMARLIYLNVREWRRYKRHKRELDALMNDLSNFAGDADELEELRERRKRIVAEIRSCR